MPTLLTVIKLIHVFYENKEHFSEDSSNNFNEILSSSADVGNEHWISDVAALYCTYFYIQQSTKLSAANSAVTKKLDMFSRFWLPNYTLCVCNISANLFLPYTYIVISIFYKQILFIPKSFSIHSQIFSILERNVRWSKVSRSTRLPLFQTARTLMLYCA